MADQLGFWKAGEMAVTKGVETAGPMVGELVCQRVENSVLKWGTQVAETMAAVTEIPRVVSSAVH